MNRHTFREQSFRMLFSLCFDTGEERERLLDNYLEETCERETEPEEREALKTRVIGIDDCRQELDRVIDSVSHSWTTARMGRAELCILRQAIWEIKHDDGIPDKVAVNEAVELAKKYADEDAPSFVNGILASVLQQHSGENGVDAALTAEEKPEPDGPQDI